MAKYKYYFPDAGLTVEEDADLARPEEDRETEASKNKRLQEQLKVRSFYSCWSLQEELSF